MKNIRWRKMKFAGLIVLSGAAVVFVMRGPVSARAAAAAVQSGQSASGLHETSMSDQTDLAVTVYNSNVALVRDTRNVSLPSGDFQLRFMDIAASVNPATVHIRSLDDPAKLSILEQNYEYDLLDAAKLLDKYVGREVTLVRNVQKNGSTETEETKATLLANNEGGPVWKVGDSIVTGMTPNGYRFSALPENLYSRPTLVWTLANSGARRQKIEASYLANNMSWKSDYVMTVARDDGSADLDGWVTLVNNAGTSFRDAKLQLVAGELNRVSTEDLEEFGIAGIVPWPRPRLPPCSKKIFPSITSTRLRDVPPSPTKKPNR